MDISDRLTVIVEEKLVKAGTSSDRQERSDIFGTIKELGELEGTLEGVVDGI